MGAQATSKMLARWPVDIARFAEWVSTFQRKKHEEHGIAHRYRSSRSIRKRDSGSAHRHRARTGSPRLPATRCRSCPDAASPVSKVRPRMSAELEGGGRAHLVSSPAVANRAPTPVSSHALALTHPVDPYASLMTACPRGIPPRPLLAAATSGSPSSCRIV